MSIINGLQEFYKSIYKGSICTGIQIETDNNGHWSVCIDLFDTVYENKNLLTQYKVLAIFYFYI